LPGPVHAHAPPTAHTAALRPATGRPPASRRRGPRGTFTVTTTTDAPHTTPLDANCTSTLPGNPCTLRAAVQAANFAAANGLGTAHTINLSVAGTYALTVTGANEDNAATGDLDIVNVNLTIANTSGGAVILDGNGADRVFEVGAGPGLGTNGQLTISNVTIQNGVVPADSRGGAISAPSSSNQTVVTITNAIIRNNSAGGGGGISSTGFLNLTNVTIDGNTAGFGGGPLLHGFFGHRFGGMMPRQGGVHEPLAFAA
jgi:CSLREA domain-containing protein